MTEIHTSRSQAETESFGRDLAARLGHPSVLLLQGPLGAGKTALVRGLAADCGVDPRIVHSPGFSLVNNYPGEPDIVHVDLYRLERLYDLHTIGLEELLEADAVVVIEWADKLPWTPPGAWTVKIEVVGAERRRLAVSCEEPERLG